MDRSSNVEEMWKYKFGMAEFEQFSLSIVRPNQEILILENIVELSDPRLSEFIGKLQRNDVLPFEISEKRRGRSIVNKKRILIK